MTPKAESPKVRPGGVVTVAFLKARLDEGNDHLGIFMPLLLDVLSRRSRETFTTADIQESLVSTHGVVMPQQTVSTLLKRATARKYLQREAGRFRLNPGHDIPPLNVPAEKAQIRESQARLADACRAHASKRGLAVESADHALGMVFRFLEDEQITMLLGAPPTKRDNHRDGSDRERVVVAEFIQDVVRSDPGLLGILKGMLEGLVLYHAAFLPDLSVSSRHFKDLRVVFDSNLVRQTLGYEGVAARTLMRETLDVLKAGGVQCLLFDTTVSEIRRILHMYEDRLATEQGRRSLRPVPMARHFLTQQYAPSDIREMAALLEHDIRAAGFQIARAPARTAEYTAGEKALAERLADRTSKDELEPRVVHDVDCVAGILSLRKGHRSASVDDAKAVFATGSPLVVRNVRVWWQEDEHETGLEPVVHIRALSNLAWLKKPSLASNFKVHELAALCAATLRPAQATWERFLKHLRSLEESHRLTSNEVTAVLVSAMSDRLLRDVEFDDDDPADVDSTTLDEVVDRVKASYAAAAEEQLKTITKDYEGRLADVDSRQQAAVARAAEDAAEAARAASSAAEKERRLMLAVEGRARSLARLATGAAQWIVTGMVTVGAGALILGHPWHGGWAGIVVGGAVVVFVALEVTGILGHVSTWRAAAEGRLTKFLRHWLGGDADD